MTLAILAVIVYFLGRITGGTPLASVRSSVPKSRA
jgi:hypothetical protein